MTNITTGTVERRFNDRKSKKFEEEIDDDNNEYQMDFYNSGLVFGSRSELGACRLNKQQERKLDQLWKLVETEKRDYNRSYEKSLNDYSKKGEILNKLKTQFSTNLEPKYYNQLNRLYNMNKFNPVTGYNYSNGTRVKSASQIAEKARQLNLNTTVPMVQSSNSTKPSRAESAQSYLKGRRSTAFNTDRNKKKLIQYPNMLLDQILPGPENTRIRVTIINNNHKVTYLTWQQHLPNAIKIIDAPLIPEITSIRTVPLKTNLHPFHPEYNLESQINRDISNPSNKETELILEHFKSLQSNNNPKQRTSNGVLKQRSLSANPKSKSTNNSFRPLSGVSSLPPQFKPDSRRPTQRMIARETDYGDQVNKIVSQFLKSL